MYLGRKLYSRDMRSRSIEIGERFVGFQGNARRDHGGLGEFDVTFIKIDEIGEPQRRRAGQQGLYFFEVQIAGAFFWEHDIAHGY